MTIPYLESLSTGELMELAVKKGLDIPPGLERIFIIEELYYLGRGAENTQHEINLVNAQHGEFKEYAILPKQYHISIIETLIRDPLWVFVFWEIKAHDRHHFESMASFNGYCLRVTPLSENDHQTAAAASFIVSVGINDYARYLGFPPDVGRCFKVDLCMDSFENYTVLAESRPFTLPRLVNPASDDLMLAAYDNPLARLSGVERFSLIRSEDRPLRRRENQGQS